MKYHRWKKLRDALKELGLTYDRTTLLKHEAEGKLILRKNSKGWRLVTDQDIKEIIKAYEPGGSGEWSYEN